MYAIVKTGGKQYKVAPGDKLNIEKLDAEVGSQVELQAICVVDGETVELDPEKAAATTVTATVLEQFRGEKQLVFKFKKRKNYKKMRGHRQYLTRVHIDSVGSVVAETAEPQAKAATSKKKADTSEKKTNASKKADVSKKAATSKKKADTSKNEDSPAEADGE